MNLLVFLEIGADVRVPTQLDPHSGRVREEWLVRELDPGSARALDLALDLKARGQGITVTAVHIGPATSEQWLRSALARGCDGAIRLWDAEAAEAQAPAKAAIAAAAAKVAGFDLILAGSSGVMQGSGQFGVLLASRLGIATVTEVIDASLHTEARALEFTRELGAGFRERVHATLPLVATVAAGLGPTQTGPDQTDAVPRIPATALLAAQAAAIQVWSLADLGVPLNEVQRADQTLTASAPRLPRRRLHPLAAPSSSLPAFERILKLLQGSAERREGRVVRRPPEEIVAEVFELLRDEGWLDHLRTGREVPGGVAGDAAGDGVQGDAADDER